MDLRSTTLDFVLHVSFALVLVIPVALAAAGTAVSKSKCGGMCAKYGTCNEELGR